MKAALVDASGIEAPGHGQRATLGRGGGWNGVKHGNLRGEAEGRWGDSEVSGRKRGRGYRGGPPDVTDPPTWRKQTNQTSGVMPANRLAAVMLATGVLMRSGMPIISSQNQIQNVT